MPYISSSIKLDESQDRRRKLSGAQHAEILSRYSAGGISQRSLAKEYGVSRKLVSLIVDPAAKRRNDERIKQHWRDYRPTKTQWAATVREHRAYKQKLFLSGQLTRLEKNDDR